MSPDAPDDAAELFPRSAGVLLPLAALPSRFGVGDLGPAAYRFVDWLAAAGFRWWQMLPVGPLGPGDSPYASSSAFAGEPLYVSLERLVEDGLLGASSLPGSSPAGPARYAEARAARGPALARAFDVWRERGGLDAPATEAFRARNAVWLEGFLDAAGSEGRDRALFEQVAFDDQWTALRAYARERGVLLMGDAPIFVGLGSIDVRSAPDLFRLDGDARPTVLTGAPPDAMNADGQLWGHPHYAWERHRETGFAWWRARMRRQMELFDAVRIDHFIGFRNAWEVPAGAGTAREGRWANTPGEDLLDAIRDELGGLPLVAEDLGSVTDEVHALRDAYGLAGMRVTQWGFSPGSYHAPHAAPENFVVYPGTHDTETGAGWWKGDLDRATRRRFRAATGWRGFRARGAAEALWRATCASHAHTAIAQAQDLIGSAERTNRPGTATGNWLWRLPPRALGPKQATRARALLEATDRVPG